tara:strand:- start:714 stop:2027 length:1314 start_codon:yes stop_codon:yes gene_type:complete
MKIINIKNIEYNLNLAILFCIAPIGYFAPIAEWLLISLLSCFSLIKFTINSFKLNYSNIFLFISICLVFLNSYFISTNSFRTLEVIGPKTGIILAVFIVIMITSKNNIPNISRILAPPVLIVSLIIFCDLYFNTEIRSTLASLIGDKPTSISANYDRGILILTAMMPITIAILYNKKKYIYGSIIFILILSIIIIGPNDTARVTLFCSLIASIIVYFLGPKSFISFGIVAAIFILFLPILSIKIFPKIGTIEKPVERVVACKLITEDKLKYFIRKSNGKDCYRMVPWQAHPSGRSMIHRILVWEFVGKEILNKPILGYGLGTSRLIGQNIILTVPNINEEIKGGIPLHPHNSFLEIWLELGIIGITILYFIWFKIIKFGYYLRRKSYILGTGACTSIISIFIISNLSFGFFQAWWMSSIGLIFLVIIQACKDNKTIS